MPTCTLLTISSVRKSEVTVITWIQCVQLLIKALRQLAVCILVGIIGQSLGVVVVFQRLARGAGVGGVGATIRAHTRKSVDRTARGGIRTRAFESIKVGMRAVSRGLQKAQGATCTDFSVVLAIASQICRSA